MLEDLAGEILSGGLTAAVVLAYVRWRLQRLEQCIDRAHLRIDNHLERQQD